MTTNEQLQDLSTLLAAEPGILLAFVFGSVAAGTARTDSDIDVALLKDHPLSAAEKTGLIEKIAEVSSRPVELIDLRTVGEPLLGEIFKGKRIVGSDEQHARLLTRHLLDVADFLPLQQRILKERRDRWINKVVLAQKLEAPMQSCRLPQYRHTQLRSNQLGNRLQYL